MRAIRATALTLATLGRLASAAAWPSAGSAPSGGVRETPPAALLHQARAAAAAGDHPGADALLRRIPHSDALFESAASELWSLYDRGGATLPVDEEALSQTASRLGAEFVRSETVYFVILSNCDRQWTAGKAQLLERSLHQFRRMMDRLGLPPTPPRFKMECVLFADHAAFQAFARTHDSIDIGWVAGYYATLSNRCVFYDDRTGPAFESAESRLAEYEALAREAEMEARIATRERQPQHAEALSSKARQLRAHVAEQRRNLREQARSASQSKTIHEAIHLISFNCGLQTRSHQFPFWVTEGLAVCFETDDASSAFGPDRATEQREREFAQARTDGLLIPLEAFVQMNQIPPDDAEAAGAMYAQAYALFRYLFRHQREALAGYFRDVTSRPGGYVAPREQLRLFEARFGRAADLERAWARHEVAASLPLTPAPMR